MFYIYLCRNDWMKRIKKQMKAYLKVVQMIRKDVFKDSDRCLLAKAKDSERWRRNWFGGKWKLIRTDALCGLNSTLFCHNVIWSIMAMYTFHGAV